jgi:protocatechuate 3,4-dioxygenase, beta subunit
LDDERPVMSHLSRRAFLVRSSSLLILPGSAIMAADKAACQKVTQAASAGPYYVANSPRMANLNRLNMPGPAMRLSGIVRSVTGSVIPNAMVEVWHCDAEGNYHPGDAGDMRDFPSDKVNLRGTLIADAQGSYAFESVVPARYSSRRRHIHWKFSAPGHKTLVTQSYWAEDLGQPAATRDFVDRSADACRHVQFSTKDGLAFGAFDVVLARG